MSYDTTLARGQLRHVTAALKRHKLGCAACSAASRSRRWDRACAQGRELHTAVTEARRELDRSIRLDRQPFPGQGSLF